MVSLTLSLGDVGGGRGGTVVLGWLETFRGSKIAASKCKGSWRQGSPRKLLGGRQESQGKGQASGWGSGTYSPGVTSSNKITTVSKVSGEERLEIWSLVNPHWDGGRED